VAEGQPSGWAGPHDPDVLFIPGPDWSDAGRYLGVEGITDFMRTYLDAWTNLSYAAEELIEAENSVVVAVHQRGTERLRELHRGLEVGQQASVSHLSVLAALNR